jgi:hypothetical protein
VFLVNVPVALVGLLAGRSILVERREQNPLAPDLAGAIGLTAAITALVLAIVKAPDWGWLSPQVIGLAAASVLLLAGIWRRSQHHVAPIVDPAMLRVPTFRLALGASVLFFAGFAAMLLNGVLFLTGAWHESVLVAGLMLFPGPLAASLFTIPSARLGARVGYRLPGLIGGLVYAAASLWWITHTSATPAYWTTYLPGMAVGGAAVGVMIPTLTGAGVSSLAPERFATGAAVLTMGRQVGAALGVAILVAVLGSATSGVSAFHAGWAISAAGGVAAALTLALMPAKAAPRFQTTVTGEASL